MSIAIRSYPGITYDWEHYFAGFVLRTIKAASYFSSWGSSYFKKSRHIQSLKDEKYFYKMLADKRMDYPVIALFHGSAESYDPGSISHYEIGQGTLIIAMMWKHRNEETLIAKMSAHKVAFRNVIHKFKGTVCRQAMVRPAFVESVNIEPEATPGYEKDDVKLWDMESNMHYLGRFYRLNLQATLSKED